jgi:hypothetical protein
MAAIILVVARLSISRILMPEGGTMGSNAKGYVESWGQDPAKDAVSSVRIGGIGSTSFGKHLRIKVMDRKTRGVLDLLSWKIDAPVSPDLMFASPISSDSIGAVYLSPINSVKRGESNFGNKRKPAHLGRFHSYLVGLKFPTVT